MRLLEPPWRSQTLAHIPNCLASDSLLCLKFRYLNQSSAKLWLWDVVSCEAMPDPKNRKVVGLEPSCLQRLGAKTQSGRCQSPQTRPSYYCGFPVSDDLWWSPPYLFRTHLVVSLISIGILTVALYESKKWPIHSLVGLVLPSTWFGQGCVTLQLGHCERDVLAWGISGRRLTNLGSNMFPICSNPDQVGQNEPSDVQAEPAA